MIPKEKPAKKVCAKSEKKSRNSQWKFEYVMYFKFNHVLFFANLFVVIVVDEHTAFNYIVRNGMFLHEAARFYALSIAYSFFLQ